MRARCRPPTRMAAVSSPARSTPDFSVLEVVGLVVIASLLFWPRLFIVGYLIFGRQIFNHAYDNWLVILAGFLILPWTTVAYGLMWGVQSASVSGVEWVVVGVAFLVDLYTWAAVRGN